MKKTPLLVVFLHVLVNSRSWVLESNVDEITPGSTKDVTLVCKNDFSKPNNARIQRIIMIRIVKYYTGSKEIIADYTVSKDGIYKNEDDIEAKANVNMEGLTYFQITWPTANNRTHGRYGCEVQFYDQYDDFGKLETSEKNIMEKALTADDVRQIVMTLTSNYEQRQKVLESEIISLNSLLKNAQQTCHSDLEKIRVDISEMRRLFNSTYPTKDEVSSKVSELKNLIGNKSLADKENCCSLVHATRDEYSNNFINLTNNFTKLAHKSDEFDNQIDSRVKILEDFLETINDKYQELNKNVKILNESYYKRPTSLLSTRKPTITEPYRPTREPTRWPNPTRRPTKTPIINRSQWPYGTYALVKPRSGCPDFSKLKILRYIHFFMPSEEADLRYVNLPKYELQSGQQHDEVELCLKVQGQETSSGSSNWPKGSYCINQYRGVCPMNFHGGRIVQRVRSYEQDIGYYSVPYCCRNDGDPDKPIQLPKDKPFYLYRYQGTCQKVEGMSTNEDYVTVDSTGPKPYSSSSTSIKPDTTEQGYPIQLCYYKPYV